VRDVACERGKARSWSAEALNRVIGVGVGERGVGGIAGVEGIFERGDEVGLGGFR